MNGYYHPHLIPTPTACDEKGPNDSLYTVIWALSKHFLSCCFFRLYIPYNENRTQKNKRPKRWFVPSFWPYFFIFLYLMSLFSYFRKALEGYTTWQANIDQRLDCSREAPLINLSSDVLNETRKFILI